MCHVTSWLHFHTDLGQRLYPLTPSHDLSRILLVVRQKIASIASTLPTVSVAPQSSLCRAPDSHTEKPRPWHRYCSSRRNPDTTLWNSWRVPCNFCALDSLCTYQIHNRQIHTSGTVLLMEASTCEVSFQLDSSTRSTMLGHNCLGSCLVLYFCPFLLLNLSCFHLAGDSHHDYSLMSCIIAFACATRSSRVSL